MASAKRTDSKGRILRQGEGQDSAGRYYYKFYDEISGTRKTVYSWKLVTTDKLPEGKKADLSLREKEEQITRDQISGVASTLNNRTTLNDLFDEFMRTRAIDLKLSSRSHYRYLFERFCENRIGKKRITDIKHMTVASFYRYLAKDEKLKYNTLQSVHSLIHSLFKLAIMNEYISKDPTQGELSEVRKKYFDIKQEKRHALSEAEQAAFINFLKESETFNHWLPMFTVFLGTGCRAGEIVALRWEDCDFKNRTISINHNLSYRKDDSGNLVKYITTPKTATGKRVIPMLDEVHHALLEEKQSQLRRGTQQEEIDGYTGFCFTGRKGQCHVPQELNATIRRIVAAYNEQETARAAEENRDPLLIRPFSAHNLRHTFCTRFCENETNIKVIQEIMGHADISTTMNVYAEATAERKQEAFKNLQGKIKIG